jgi:hypothetical protein
MSTASGNTRLLLCFLLLFSFVPAAFSQSDTGVLFGVVSDPAARTISGARVTLKHNATGASREYVTDERGVYFFTFLPPGAYTMQFEADGFKKYQDADVRVQVAQVTRLDVEMAIGSVKEVMDVSGASRALSTDSAALS